MNKKQFILLLAGCCFLLAACSGQKGEANQPGNAEEQDASAALEENLDASAVPEENQDASAASEADTDASAASEENLDAGMVQEEASFPEEGSGEEPFYYVIDNSGPEYYLTEKIVSEDDFVLSLEQLTEESNEIIDTEKWFTDNGLPQVEFGCIEDEQYCYQIYGFGHLLDISRKDTGENLGCLSFEKYRYMEPVKAGDENYVEQQIWWAQAVENVLYVSVGHNTYTESCPNTGYLVAIDLNDMSVIWKSEPCVTNGRNFEIIDNTIVCGYGFTSEPDYLILVNRLDGSVIEKLPIKTMAEYIFYQGDTLYVRTYNTNYTFQVWRAIDCH